MSVKRVENMLRRKDINGLSRMLTHRDVLVRRRAAQALGELRHPSAVPALAKALKPGEDEYVVQWSIDSLVAIADPTAIDALTAVMFTNAYRQSGMAGQALAAINDPQARAAIELRDIVQRSDWDALSALGEESFRPIGTLMHSEQYASWPTAKRRQLLEIATRLGVTMAGQDRELSSMGLFMSGIHSVGDLIRGLRHRSADVRISAANSLAMSGVDWTTGPLFRRFKRELRDGKGERSVAIAIARAMSQLEDNRAIEYFKRLLYNAESNKATDAARALAEVGTPDAVETLFWFAASPPPPPAYRNVPLALSALGTVGPSLVEVLRTHFDHDDPQVRRLVMDVALRSKHPDLVDILSQFARDPDEDIQHTALDAIADLNTEAAAGALRGMSGDLPQRWITRALAAITHPAGPRLLRELVPDLTDISGLLLDEERLPRPHATVQIVKEHNFGGAQGYDWMAVSARARTDDEGRFALSLLSSDEEGRFRVKVTVPGTDYRTQGDSYLSDFTPVFGVTNDVQLRIDGFFKRLMVTNRTYERGF